MKIRNFVSKIFPVIAISTLSVEVLADGGRFFVQADIGSSNVDFKGKGVFVSEVSGVDRATDTGDSTDTAGTLRAGYWFNEYFGVETFYNRLHDGNMKYTEVYEVFNLDGELWLVDTEVESVPLEVSGYGLGGVAKKSFSGFFISGRVGATNLDAEFPAVGNSSTEVYYGASVGYDFNDMFGLSLNYDIQKTGFSRDEVIEGEQINYDADFDIKTASLGAQYRF